MHETKLTQIQGHSIVTMFHLHQKNLQECKFCFVEDCKIMTEEDVMFLAIGQVHFF